MGLFQAEEETGEQLGAWEVSCVTEEWRGMTGRTDIGNPGRERRKREVVLCFPQGGELTGLGEHRDYLQAGRSPPKKGSFTSKL